MMSPHRKIRTLADHSWPSMSNMARVGCTLAMSGCAIVCCGGSEPTEQPATALADASPPNRPVTGGDSSPFGNAPSDASGVIDFDGGSPASQPEASAVGAEPEPSFDDSGRADLDASADDAGAIATPPPSDGGPVGMHYDGIYSGVPLVDTAGNLVNAHGVGFLHVGSTYYMIGEQRSGKNDTYSGSSINAEDSFTGVSLYSTTDLANWTFVGTIVKPIAGTVVAPPYYGERPKILFNAKTSKFVVYIKMLNYTSSYTGYYAVLTSDKIDGPYAYHGNLNVGSAEDFEVFQDADGSQYLVAAGGKISKLSADGLSVASTVASGVQSGEGVSLFSASGTYFYQSSKGTYWHSNDNSYSSASSLGGPWTAHGVFCPAGTMTWQSQDTAVLPVVGSSGTTYIYVGDRWVNGDLPASTLVMQPLKINGSTESIAAYQPAWKVDVAAGTWSPIDTSGTSINDNEVGTAQNQFNYGTGWVHSNSTGCFDGDVHSSSVAGATATITFRGSQISLYSAYDGSSGIMGITLADSQGSPLLPELNVSLRYDAAPAGNYMVYTSPIVPSGTYSLKVRVTGKKDLYSSGNTCNIDRVVVAP